MASEAKSIAKANECLSRCLGEVPGRCVFVSVADQRLLLLSRGVTETGYPVSTARIGLSAKEGSGGTPPGVHRIAKKIGAGVAEGTVFKSRVPTGAVWTPGVGEGTEDDLILTRILTLEGLEEGVNRGEGVDSLARCIYIHGTNHEREIGTPVSGGCIRMTNADILDLFDRVEEGDPVVII
ncbi:MAG: L,D-transpeptidase [Candidatus Eisenbacteria sp.]|nr:L,D-transpeptidase [Candidatus Eisenbacteria bacterium]